MARARRLAMAAAVALALIVPNARPLAATAVPGYDSTYFGESAFAVLQPGQSNQFAVGFTNTGAIGWARATASQVNLAQCCPLNTPSPNSAWAVSWLSNTAYATMTTDFVGPGQIGWFVYTVKAPPGAAPGNYRFDGDLVLAATGEGIHRDGYFQIATVPALPALPEGGPPIGSAVTSVTCLDLREIKVQFTQAMAMSGSASALGREHYTLSGGLEIDGVRASVDATSVVLTAGRSVSGVGAHDGAQLSADPTTFMSQNGTYALTVSDVATSRFQMTQPSTTTFSCVDGAGPTVMPRSVAGAGTIVLAFSEPMDPASVSSSLRWDGIPISSIGRLRWQDRSANVCASAGGCHTVLRLDFLKNSIPSQGNHSLEIRDATDAAGFKLSPNPSSFTVNMPGPSSAAPPPVSEATVTAVGGGLRVDVTFSESMAHTANGFTASESIDTAANYVLRNPDGGAATTSGVSGTGSAVTFDRVLPDAAPTNASIPADERQLLAGDAPAFQLRRVRLVLGPLGDALRPGVSYSLEIQNVRDQTGMAVTPGTVKTIAWGGDLSAPQALRAFASASQLRVDYSESMLADPAAGTATNASDPARYTSMDSPLKSSLAGMTFARLTDDGTAVVFNLTTPLASGSYRLDVGGTRDPFGNAVAQTQLVVAAIDTQRPTLVGATKASDSELRVTFSEAMKSAATDAASAGNPANYSIDNASYGTLCNSGSATISADPIAANGQQTFRIVCSGLARWSAAGTHTLTVKDVQDLSGNAITPNPTAALSF